jgi:hypothetical protein
MGLEGHPVFELAPIAYVLVVLAALLYSRTAPGEGLLLATAFLIPWFGLQTDIGITVTADRLIATLLLLGLVAKRGIASINAFLPFIAYAVLDTLAQSMNLPATVADYSATKGQWRWLLQMPMWLLYVVPGAAARLASWDTVRKVLRVLVVSGTLLAAMGIVQVAVYYLSGFDMFPIGMLADSEGRYAAFATEQFGGGIVFRACALGGEPKHLAYTLVTCLSIVASDRVFGGVLGLTPRQVLASTGLCLAALVLTFSTQGFLLLALDIVAIAIVAIALRGWSRRNLVLGLMLVAILGAFAINPDLVAVIYDRSVGRISDTSAVEDWNQAVWDWLRETPSAWLLGVGLGNVHLYAADYIPAEGLFYMKGNVFVAKSGLLRIVSELGLIGVGFLGVLAMKGLNGLRTYRHSGSPGAAMASTCLLAVTVNFLFAQDGPVFLFLFIGLALAASAKSPALGVAVTQ